MDTPTTLLSPKINELMQGAIESEIESRSNPAEDLDKLREIIMIQLVGAYTCIEGSIASHQGPFSQFFRDGMVERFERTKYVRSHAAKEIVSYMIYEHQLKAGRKAS